MLLSITCEVKSNGMPLVEMSESNSRLSMIRSIANEDMSIPTRFLPRMQAAELPVNCTFAPAECEIGFKSGDWR